MQPFNAVCRNLFTALLLALAASACRPAPSGEAARNAPAGAQAGGAALSGTVLDPSQRPEILEAMRSELERSRTSLKAKTFPAPYFVAYRINDLTRVQVAGRAGGVFEDSAERQRGLYTEVRVGDYGFDNTGGNRFKSGGGQFSFFGWSRPPFISLDSNADAIRFDLWASTDSEYKDAVSNFLQRKANEVTRVDRYKTASFARAEPVSYQGPAVTFSPDLDVWRERVRTLSARLKARKEIIDSEVRFSAYGTERFLLNTEGTSIADADAIYSLMITANGRAEDGEAVQAVRNFYGRSESDFPSAQELESLTDEAGRELTEIRVAPVQTPYTGPAILSPRAAGVFFHEAVGHRLEGERQDDDQEGQTFADKLETEIIPPFLDVYDDPSQKTEGTIPLNGYYLYDDDGVPARKTVLIEKGVLKDFLLSRAPIRQRDRSNGHGRASMFMAPMARMGNLVVRSSKTVSRENLFEELRAEARRQGKPYGLYVEEVDGGETNTSRWGVQTFKGVARKLYQVDTETGALTLVRGADIVGTPLASIRKISLTGDDYHVFNGFCGAESGYVPVSAVAPSVLVTEIEVQRRSEEPLTQPILPPPAARP